MSRNGQAGLRGQRRKRRWIVPAGLDRFGTGPADLVAIDPQPITGGGMALGVGREVQFHAFDSFAIATWFQGTEALPDPAAGQLEVRRAEEHQLAQVRK